MSEKPSMTAISVPSEPTRLLIAALGGEGGGVLAGWITEAAVASGLVTCRTSIPGVAQRTGATTYYIEMVRAEPDRPRPVLALNPAPGHVDVLLASELLEATRLAAAGMTAADRTTLIANTARTYTMDEKMAMADGRADSARLTSILEVSAKRLILADLKAAATATGAPISAVLLGALAAAHVLPLTDDALRDAIRREGKSVTANLAGFQAGYAAAIASKPVVAATSSSTETTSPPSARVSALAEFPARTSVVAAEGFARLTDYQDEAYANQYLARLRRFAALPGMDDATLSELARHLAVRMSVEDVIRVAQLKLRQARVDRVTAEARARPGDIVDITEFMKPGPEEILGLLPAWLARPLLRLVARAGWSSVSLPLRVTTTRLSGFLRLKFLADLRRWRPATLKFKEETAWIERWLDLIEATHKRDPTAAGEVITLAKIVRGYGATYKHGLSNFDRIVAGVVQPALDRNQTTPELADQILQSRIAAEKDPEGTALAATLEAIANRSALSPQMARAAE